MHYSVAISKLDSSGLRSIYYPFIRKPIVGPADIDECKELVVNSISLCLDQAKTAGQLFPIRYPNFISCMDRWMGDIYDVKLNDELLFNILRHNASTILNHDRRMDDKADEFKEYILDFIKEGLLRFFNLMQMFEEDGITIMHEEGFSPPKILATVRPAKSKANNELFDYLVVDPESISPFRLKIKDGQLILDRFWTHSEHPSNSNVYLCKVFFTKEIDLLYKSNSETEWHHHRSSGTTIIYEHSISVRGALKTNGVFRTLNLTKGWDILPNDILSDEHLKHIVTVDRNTF